MISIDDEDEKKIRRYAQEMYGGKKGSLSEVFIKAIKEFFEHQKREKEKEEYRFNLIKNMKNAKKLNILKDGKAYASRAELYER